MVLSTFFISLFILFSSALVALPSQVILMRHAEKPSSGDTLNKVGFERANALVTLLTTPGLSFELQEPAAIYAQRASANHASTRPVQTVAGLANVWQVPLYTSYSYAEYPAMCKEIMTTGAYDDKLVIVCWSRDHLGDIAKTLGVSNAGDWPSGVYDRFWVITYDSNGQASFQNIPQQLLFGDSAS